VKVLVVGAAVRELVNQPGVAMKVENNRLLNNEEFLGLKNILKAEFESDINSSVLLNPQFEVATQNDIFERTSITDKYITARSYEEYLGVLENFEVSKEGQHIYTEQLIRTVIQSTLC